MTGAALARPCDLPYGSLEPQPLTIPLVGKLGPNLREARLNLELSQEQVAERSGVHATDQWRGVRADEDRPDRNGCFDRARGKARLRHLVEVRGRSQASPVQGERPASPSHAEDGSPGTCDVHYRHAPVPAPGKMHKVNRVKRGD